VRAISGENGPFDLPVILGIVFVVAVTVVLLTLIVDLLYGSSIRGFEWDPRRARKASPRLGKVFAAPSY
jgi:hypothetical protein